MHQPNLQRLADELAGLTSLDWERLRLLARDSLAGRAEVDRIEQHCSNLRADIARLKWWERYAETNKPLIHIGGEKNPYLIRWAIVDGKGAGNNVYLHKFLRDDEDRALHDHPWDSVSILLSGTLREIDEANPRGKIVNAGQVRHRAADYAHRLVVVEQGFSLFITGPKVREWGFLCAEGWRHWTRFAAGESGELVGIGCGDYSDPITEASPILESISTKRLAMGRGARS